MYDEALIEIAVEADMQLRANLTHEAPFIAREVDAWLDEMFGGLGLAEIFTRSDAFPMLLIPWWVDGSIGERDRRLHRALTYSTMNGYLYIRLVDNLMDRDAAGEVSLLPALSFFHFEFVEPYRRLFEPGDRFWSDLRTTWLATADVTMNDAQLADIDKITFERVSARKTGAAKIPVAAVSHYRRRLHRQPEWNDFTDAFGRWHQMHNDIFSWRKDADHQAATYFLSEGRRRRPNAAIDAWVVDEGFSWGMDELDRFMTDLRRIAGVLKAEEALAYLDEREVLLALQEEDVMIGLAALSSVRDVVGR